MRFFPERSCAFITRTWSRISKAAVRRILDFCGLEFEAQCVEFHKTERSIRTASSEQVRQPLYRDGLEQWRNFEPYLEPLERALGDAIERHRD